MNIICFLSFVVLIGNANALFRHRKLEEVIGDESVIIPDQYIVTYHENVTDVVSETLGIIAMGTGTAYIAAEYGQLLNAVSVSNLKEHDLELFLQSDQVRLVEKVNRKHKKKKHRWNIV